MPSILWDASALAKRYTSETGTDTINAIFQFTSQSPMVLTPWGYAETYFILVKKHNEKLLNAVAFNAATAKLRLEAFGEPGFSFLTVRDTLIFGSLKLIRSHSLNSADAAILAAYLRFAQASDDACILIASDKRLLRAASAEGLKTLNPETLPAADVPDFLLAA